LFPTDRKPWKISRFIVLLSILLPLAFIQTRAQAEGTQTFTGKVVGVSDGDTITVMHQGRGEKVRLAGIDCPEKKQAFGTRAKQFTSDASFGKFVTVKVETIDRYGRTVGEVILPDGKILNRELVSVGFAWWYRQYSNDESLGQLEVEARTAKRGLWVEPNPIPPWEFRKLQRAVR